MADKETTVRDVELSDARFRQILDKAQARWGKDGGLRYLYFYLAKGAELNSPQVLDWLEDSIEN